MKYLNYKLSGALLVAALLVVGSPARAYRPFDSTDADVVDPGELELEIAPLSLVREGTTNTLLAPGGVANLGLLEGFEIVMEAQRAIFLDAASGDPAGAMVDAGLFIKGMLRNGSLQQGTGPSVAFELGLLFPEDHPDSALGGELILIGSMAWAPLLAHLNLGAAATSEQHAEYFAGLILEGPEEWTVCPAIEGTVAAEIGEGVTVSALLGGIWRVEDDLSVDVGVVLGREVPNGENPDVDLFEIRAGLTWSRSLFGFR